MQRPQAALEELARVGENGYGLQDRDIEAVGIRGVKGAVHVECKVGAVEQLPSNQAKERIEGEHSYRRRTFFMPPDKSMEYHCVDLQHSLPEIQLTNMALWVSRAFGSSVARREIYKIKSGYFFGTNFMPTTLSRYTNPD